MAHIILLPFSKFRFLYEVMCDQIRSDSSSYRSKRLRAHDWCHVHFVGCSHAFIDLITKVFVHFANSLSIIIYRAVKIGNTQPENTTADIHNSGVTRAEARADRFG